MTPQSQLQNTLELVRSNQFAEALQQFELLVQNPATRDEALGHRAWLFRIMGRYDESLKDYRAIFESNPQRTDSEAMYADTLLAFGEDQKAFEIALSILHKDPLNRVAPQVIIKYQQARVGNVPEEKAYRSVPGQNFQPLNPIIDLLERDENSYPTSSYPEFGRLLYALVKCVRPSVIVETGCYVGYSSLCIALAMEENQRGHLHSFDLFCEYPQYISPLIGPSPDTMQAARAHLEQSSLNHRVTLYRGDSSANIVNQFANSGTKIDMAFIDGDHAIPGCFKDWNAVQQFLAPGAIVVLHDTMPVDCGWMGPRYVLERLSADPQHYQCITLPTPEGFGIGIVQKISTRDHRRIVPGIGALLRHRITQGKKLQMKS